MIEKRTLELRVDVPVVLVDVFVALVEVRLLAVPLTD